MNNGQVDANTVDLTLQVALAATTETKFVPAVKLALGGHAHCFEELSFEDGRPSQIISGAGGTLLDPLLTEDFLNAHADLVHQLGMDREDFQYIHNVNFLLMTPAAGGGWDVSKTIRGTVQALPVVSCFDQRLYPGRPGGKAVPWSLVHQSTATPATPPLPNPGDGYCKLFLDIWGGYSPHFERGSTGCVGYLGKIFKD